MIRANDKRKAPAPAAAELRRRAEARLTKLPRKAPSDGADVRAVVDAQRLLHELQVHQIELEMQNAELQESRERTEALLETYTDLYDFAPVGYLSLDEKGRILTVNLTGAALLGMERSRLIAQPLARFVAPTSRSGCREFVQRVFTDAGKQSCETELLKGDGSSFWASLHGCADILLGVTQKACRVAVSDVTSIRLAQEAQRHVETLSASNVELKREIAHRQTVEEALRQSEQHQRLLLEQSHHLQDQLRMLSHQMLQTREEERRRISRDLHDVITQTLVGIEFHLAALSQDAAVTACVLRRKISTVQRLVEKAVKVVHDFASVLRPTSLDDLGLISTLNTFLSEFLKQTGIRVHLAASAAVDHLSGDLRTALYRIVQAALTNVAEHSHASRAGVSLRNIKDAVQLEITDDGDAFDVERAFGAKGSRPLGLIGMRERAEMLGGTFRVESEPGKGTTIHVVIPTH